MPMPNATIFTIEDGQFGLDLVDTAAVGYLDSWQAPTGKTVDAVTLADYDASSASFQCQVTSGALSAAPDTTTIDIPATWCNPAKSIPQPAETAYSLDLSFLQDPNIMAGLSRYLFENDTQEAYFYLGFNNSSPPRAIGRLRLVAGTIGGAARSTLAADVSLALSRKPDVEFGDTTTSIIINGDGTTATPAAAPTATTSKSTSTSTPQPAAV